MRSKLLAVAVVLALATVSQAADDGLAKGTPEVKSANALAFGPNGLLFVGDTQSATIFAIEMLPRSFLTPAFSAISASLTIGARASFSL